MNKLWIPAIILMTLVTIAICCGGFLVLFVLVPLGISSVRNFLK